MLRASLLVLAGLTAAPLTGGAAAGVPQSAPVASVRPGVTTAVVSVRSAAAKSATLELGTDRAYGLRVFQGTTGRKHVFRLAGLAPARHYEYRITVGGRAARGSFSTRAASEPIKVGLGPGGFATSEGPFFPILSQLDNCVDPRGTVSRAVGMGVVILAGHSVLTPAGKPKTCRVSTIPNPPWKPLDDLLARRAWFFDYRASERGEAANLKGLPEQATWPGLVDTLYGADELVSCASTGNTLTYSIVHAKALQQPLVYIIPLSDQFRHGSEKLCITPRRVEAEFWTAIAAGARGIDYATFGSPTSRNPDFAVEDGVRRQAARQDARLATLGPAILTGTPVPIPSASLQVRYGAWEYGGSLYLVAVNTASTPTTTPLLLRAFAGKTADVLWEGRALHLPKGVLTDHYGPLAVRIYRIS